MGKIIDGKLKRLKTAEDAGAAEERQVFKSRGVLCVWF